MKITIGADHGGFQLKNSICATLAKEGIEVIDFGTNSCDSVDYPDYAKKVGDALVSGEADFGVLICTTGIGISISANKVKGVRAALCHNEDCAKFARMHNNANIVCMGAKYVGKKLADAIVKTFIETTFESSGRHAIRVSKIEPAA